MRQICGMSFLHNFSFISFWFIVRLTHAAHTYTTIIITPYIVMSDGKQEPINHSSPSAPRDLYSSSTYFYLSTLLILHKQSVQARHVKSPII